MTTIKRGNTAISRKTHSIPYRVLLEKGYLNKDKRILDFGCGKGFDVETLKEQGYNIKGFDKFQDKYNDSSIIEYCNSFDLVTCNYVFNVIEDIEERKELLTMLKDLGWVVIISVRADIKSVKNTWKKHNDGYITPKGTFQKFYTMEDVERDFNNNMFWNFEVIRSTSSEIIFSLTF